MGLTSQPADLPADSSAAPSGAVPDDLAVWAPSSSWDAGLVTAQVLLRWEEPVQAALAPAAGEAEPSTSFDWASWVRRRRDLARTGSLL